MKFLLLLTLILLVSRSFAEETREMLIVVSEPGNPAYEQEFQRQAKAWQTIAEKGKISVQTIGIRTPVNEGDRPALEKIIAAYPKTGGDLWLVWIGHGSFDGRTANFNLRGTDIDAPAVAELLKPFNRRLVLLHLFSASGQFLPALSADNRVIVCATRGGGEKNFTRFGEKLADALSSTDADLDLDGSLSLLEAILQASATTRSFYEDAQRVVQEHAVIDDNGDGRPTAIDAFKGLRADAPAADGTLAREIRFLTTSPDPLPAAARENRAMLEQAINALRKRKPQLPEKKYYDLLEKLMLDMAVLYGKKS